MSPGAWKRQEPGQTQRAWQRGGNERGTQQSPLALCLCSWRERCPQSLCFLVGILYLPQVPGKHQLELSHSPRSANYIQLGPSRMSHPADTTQLTEDKDLPSTWDYTPAALETAPCLWNRQVPRAAYSCPGIGRMGNRSSAFRKPNTSSLTPRVEGCLAYTHDFWKLMYQTLPLAWA